MNDYSTKVKKLIDLFASIEASVDDEDVVVVTFKWTWKKL
jgi:hypothetical protein